ncbi:SpoIID/LytB domain-containing protein [Frisingicoccus sp.]|uniref:SpoIID/LytB domain-containing protein n=1 Tax=Frisingicoccus sp. TaxID=1918627 RepID=UPI003870A85E
MRRFWVRIIILGAGLSVLVLYFFYLHREWTENEMISRSQIARMLALIRYDREDCENLMDVQDKIALPEDVNGNEWYGCYVFTTCYYGWMTVKEDGLFHPLDKFTYGDLRYIMEQFHISEDHLSFSIGKRQSDGMVPREQWCEVYQLIIADTSHVNRQHLKIYGTPSNVTGLDAWQILTDDGVKSAEGLAVDAYMDREVEVYETDGEILCFIKVVSDDISMENVWIKEISEKQLDIFYDGFERTIRLEHELDGKIEPNMGDLGFTDGKLTSIAYKPNRWKASLLEIKDTSLVLQDFGEVKCKANMVIYQIYPEPRLISKENLKTDGTVYEFVLEDDEICGVIYQAYTEETIRVLLHENAGNYEHDQVSLTSDDDFMVIKGENIYKYKRGTELTFALEDESFDGEGEIQIKTETAEGKIQLLSLERSCGNPSYHGEIHLQKWGNGIIIVNEVNIEDYVAGVVPSEMPVSYGIEALKAQAVCARTFARGSLKNNFKDYPANLDDTVSSQVYNNQEESMESIQAAQMTRGQVLENEEGLTATYFFSTSCGHTSSPEDVWFDGSPSDKAAGVSVFLSDDSVELELEKESDFRTFINLEDGTDYFEESLPWFRWQVFIAAGDIEKGVDRVCQTDIGILQNISVLDRGESGVLKAIQIQGSENECTVYGEYRIRQIFSPENAELIPHIGESVTGWTMLPSGYIYFDPVIEGNQCQGYRIYGGGYGHGCGMSQNGAMKMAEHGKTYDEILKYFFPDSKLVSE